MPIPDNVELRLPPAGNDLLYGEADVCVQPSHWEGLGLGLLECQAAGIPLVTTDAPTDERVPAPSRSRARKTELVSVLSNHVISSHSVAPEDLAATLESLYRTDISGASEAARSFIEAEHSWEKALPLLIRCLPGEPESTEEHAGRETSRSQTDRSRWLPLPAQRRSAGRHRDGELRFHRGVSRQKGRRLLRRRPWRVRILSPVVPSVGAEPEPGRGLAALFEGVAPGVVVVPGR